MWWGWWRKQSEPPHLAELDQLRELSRKASSEAPFYVGLFDRSTDTFYRAIVIDCVFSDAPMKSPEPAKTPAYYSGEAVAAWLRLTRIETLSKDEFVNLCGSVPIGDLTFWAIDEAEPRPSGLSTPWNGVPELRSNIVAHLSDIHFGSDHAFPERASLGKYPLLEILRRDIEMSAHDGLGLLVLSGDLITKADSPMLFERAIPFLEEAIKVLKIEREQVIIVPGNHDIPLQTYKPIDYSHESTFRAFLKLFYGRPSEIAELRRFRLPWGAPLELLLINSVRLRKVEEGNFGFVQWGLYDPLLRSNAYDPEVFRMAVMHHHLIPAPREEHQDPNYPAASLSATLDSGAVLDGLQSHHFHLVVHGHQHVPGVSKVARGSIPVAAEPVSGLDGGIYIVAGGSAGSERLTDEMRDNCYNLIVFTKDKGFTVEARRFNPGRPNVTRYFVTRELR